MKSLIFDSGPIISLAMNNLLWLLSPLKKQFQGSFVITPGVKNELIDHPMEIKRFEFEALQVLKELNVGTLTLFQDERLADEKDHLLELANRLFWAGKRPIPLVHSGEMETVAAALMGQAGIVVVDERTTRLLLEQPKALLPILQHKMHATITLRQSALKIWQDKTAHLQVIRSLELVLMAYRMGLLDSYISQGITKKTLLDSLLWGLRLNGCSLPNEDLDDLLQGNVEGFP
ncbi:MAG: hypothetical protein ABIH34_03090 [Nanoarchaeota archaeon]